MNEIFKQKYVLAIKIVKCFILFFFLSLKQKLELNKIYNKVNKNCHEIVLKNVF